MAMERKTPSEWAAHRERITLLEAQMLYAEAKRLNPAAIVQVLTPDDDLDTLTELRWQGVGEAALYEEWSRYVTKVDDPCWFIYGVRARP